MASGAEATRRIRQLTVAAACVCLILLSHSHIAVRERSAMRVLARLALLQAFRPIEPRLSIDLPHAPFRVPAPGDRFAELRHANPALAFDVASLMNTAASGARARSAADLLLANWNATIERLTHELEQHESATPWLDLASAYYMRGLTTRSLKDFAQALQCLSRAEPSPRVTFNRALVLEQLHDREGAAAEWKTYLALDDRSPWAHEAREHLRKASQRPRAMGPSRRQVERELLPQWAEMSLSGDVAAARDGLNRTRAIAEDLSRRSGDRLLPNIISEIDQSSPPARRQYAKALAAYGAGRRAVEQQDHSDALRELLRARELFQRLGSRGDVLVTSYLVTARYLAGDYESSDRFDRELQTRCRGLGSDCTAAFAHVDWVRGMSLFRRGYPSQSLEAFSRALRGFERLGEAEQQASQHSNLADTYQYLGDADRAAVHRYHALVLAEDIDDARRLEPILSEAADSAASDALPAASFVFQDRMVRLARASRDPYRIAMALAVRSTLHLRLGKRGAALRDVEEARRVAALMKDPEAREKMAADLDAAEAFAVREVDERRAIDLLDRSIAFMRSRESHISRAQLLLERGRARLRLDDDAGAERDFHDGIAELEEQRHRVGEPELRIAYFDRAERLFSDLALLLLRRGRVAEAFEALERSRARELLDAATGVAMQPMRLEDIQRQLGAGVTIVTYTLAGDRVVMAIVTRDALRFVERRIREDDLPRLVENISRGFDSAQGLPPNDLRRLHDTLIAPLRLATRTRLVVIPDRFLYRVPFAALLAPNGRYLVEDYVIAIAPSSTIYIRNAARDCVLAARGASSILLVPSPERPDGYAALEPLVHATSEAAAIAKEYPVAKIAHDPDEDVLRDGETHAVIHFGTHAVLNENAPAESMLLLGRSERLRVAQIEAARLRRTRLVVLGACSSGIGKTHRGEGVLSLARAFMSASVPSVVSTVAPVEDAAAARLLTSFHAAYARGLDPASALRHAQMAILRSSNRSFAGPARWSAFQVIGGACANANQREEETQWASY